MSLPHAERWARLSPMLDELLDLSPEAQAARLASLRASDPASANELETLLQASHAAQAAGLLSGDAGLGSMVEASLVGQRIGAYRLEALVGQGGSGAVWRARRDDGRYEGHVAIKLLHLSWVGHASAERFQREGAILARLTHPNIAHMLDAGVTPGGQPYLVLELIDGERIDRYADAQGLSVERRIVLFAQVLAALTHAHSHLVIHRDIKPGNILVGRDGRPKLLDFGIAKLLEERSEPDGSSPSTRDGARALTPEYAAPEQLRGEAVTTATDVYALGVVLYELLAGCHPTALERAGSTHSRLATIETDPTLLSSAVENAAAPDAARIAAERATTPQRLARQLRGDLSNIVARCLRKAPQKRYLTPGELGEDLRRYLAHEPVSARADSLPYRGAKFLRRHRGAVAAGLLVVSALAAGLAGTFTQAQRAEAQALRARHERDNALRQLAYAASANQFISFLLEQGSDKPFTTTELLARGEVLVEQQFRADPAQQASLNLMLGSLYAEAEQPGKAEALTLRAQTVARGASDPSLQAEIECELASERGWSGSFEPARLKIDAAIATLRAAPELDRDTLAKCLFARSQVNKISGDAKAALADAQAALDTIGAPRSHQRMPAIYFRAALAEAQSGLGRSAEAVGAYEQAIAELDAMGRGDTRLMAVMRVNLGANLASSGQTLRAVESYERALHSYRGFGENGAIPTLEANYAGLLVELGRPREAMPLIEHARSQAAANGNKLLTAIVSLRGAPAWCATQALARCAELLAAAEAGFIGVLPPGHSRFGNLKMAQAQLALARADLKLARAGLKQAVAIFDAATDRNSIGIRALTLLARTEQQLGELADAEADAARAVTQARETMTGFAHSERLGSALVAQGLVQQARGRAAAAQASWRDALAELQPTVGDAAPATAEAHRLLAGS